MEKIIETRYDGSTLEVDVHYQIDKSDTIIDLSTGYVPAKGDRIYLMPGVNIPRVKLKDLALSHGVSIVRDPEKANIVIAGKATVHKISRNIWVYHFKTEDVVNFINNTDLDGYYKEKLSDALISAPNTETIMVHYGNYRTLSEAGLHTTNFSGSTHINLVEADYTDILDEVQGKPMFPESELLAMINGDDAITIKEEVYKQISQMFESSDQDNHIMAMEIMANCKYEDSALYLLLLLEGYANKIGECHTRNHVNFKSLLSYFELTNRTVDHLDPNGISDNLIKLGLLTKEWVHELFVNRSEWIMRNIAYSRVFNITKVSVSQDVLQAIGEPYVASVEKNVDTHHFTINCTVDISKPIEKEVAHDEEERVMPEPELEIYDELPAPPEEVQIDLEIITIETPKVNESTDIDWF